MKATVRVSKNQLARFRKFARETGKEIQAYLVGRVVNPELTVIESFHYTKTYAIQTTNTVCWLQEDYDKVQHEAEKSGKRIVGDLHSHPDWDCVMSPNDYSAHIGDGHRICGICSTQTTDKGRKTRVRFWIAESALPCILEYV